ncbi:MAG TPA: NAD(P)H-binding protein [Gemmatimonadaceae bacterium]|nr:NAD(P)H-binding protein [Gemmatimonadaceae bacterium]
MADHRAFIAGATGYTGREVARCLATLGVRTVAHVRPDSPRLGEWRDRFAAVGAATDATPWERAAMTDTLARLRPTLVFALLGTTRARARDTARAGGGTESYETVDYGLTHLLLEAATEAARTTGVRPRFVYLSAIGAREDTRNAYMRVRGRIERELRQSGLPWLAVRPAFITGDDRDESRPLERITARAMDAALALPALLGARRLRARYHSMSGTALGCGMARLALRETGEGRVVMGEEVRG